MEMFTVYHLCDLRPAEQRRAEHNFEILDIQHKAELHVASKIFKNPTATAAYMKAAEVTASCKDQVFSLTNNIEHAWTLNKQVKSTGLSNRSTSVGDVVLDSLGIAWMCDFSGWKKLHGF